MQIFFVPFYNNHLSSNHRLPFVSWKSSVYTKIGMEKNKDKAIIRPLTHWIDKSFDISIQKYLILKMIKYLVEIIRKEPSKWK